MTGPVLDFFSPAQIFTRWPAKVMSPVLNGWHSPFGSGILGSLESTGGVAMPPAGAGPSMPATGTGPSMPPTGVGGLVGSIMFMLGGAALPPMAVMPLAPVFGGGMVAALWP